MKPKLDYNQVCGSEDYLKYRLEILQRKYFDISNEIKVIEYLIDQEQMRERL